MQAVWFGVCCVALTLIAGFGVGGWETRATVQQQLTHAGAGVQRVKEAAWHERDDIVAEGGWATLPGSTLPNYAVAEMCAAKLAQLKAGDVASLTQSAEMRTTR